MYANYFSAEASQSQLSKSNFHSNSTLKASQQPEQRRQGPHQVHHKTIHMIDLNKKVEQQRENQSQPVKLRFIKSKRYSQAANERPRSIVSVQKKCSPTKIKEYQQQSQIIKGKKGAQNYEYQSVPRSFNISRELVSRDGSVERRSGDREEHLQEKAAARKSQNSRSSKEAPHLHRNMQENIFESRAYLSNDPNISNLREELAAVASRKARLILNDPFQDHADPSSHQFDLNDFENLNEIQESSHENFKSRYRSNYENYKSVGSINKSVRSPTQAQQQKPPKSAISAVSVG